MGRVATPLFCVSLVLVAGSLLALNGCGDAYHPPQRVVIIFQENRTPDNLFHDSVLMDRGADIATTGIDSQNNVIPLQKVDLNSRFDLDHSHGSFMKMYAGGKMNGADLIHPSCDISNCIPPHPQFSYVDPDQVRPYFAMAEQYTFGDRMFQTNQGPSFPAHQFILSGTSAPTASSSLFAQGNPHSTGNHTQVYISNNAGCIGPSDEFVTMIDPAGNIDLRMYPCFEHATLTDLLEAKGITWRYYAASQGHMFTAPTSIQHMCQPEIQNGQLVCAGPSYQNVVIPQTRVLDDIANNQLAQVSWVMPNAFSSDHPGSVSEGSGPSWVASIVNAIGNSPYWQDTTIIVTWDDWGGWYDHVKPDIINSYEYGFRVPLIVISPYARRAYISHQKHDFGSILKYIENEYALPSLGYADVAADNLSGCFDYRQQPTEFQTIAAPLSANHFLQDRRPAGDPDDY